MSVVMYMQNCIKYTRRLKRQGQLHFLQNLNLGKTSINTKWHLTISWAISCQYHCVWKMPSQQSTQFKRYCLFYFFFFFQNLELGKASTDDLCHFAISWDRPCHINVYEKVYQNILNGFRVMTFSFTFFTKCQIKGNKIFTNCPETKSNVWL